MDYDNPLFVHTPGFLPVVTGEEMCRAVAAIGDHVMAIIPKGREVWEIHIDQGELRDRVEVEGIVLRGRLCEVSPRFPGGTWVRVRGLPLNATNAFVDRFLSEYGEVVIGSTHATWRNTAIRTGDRTLKLKISRDIPGRLKSDTFGWITIRYRDQPDLCFTCGKPGHQQWACEEFSAPSYAAVVQVGPAPTPTPDAEPIIPTTTSSELDTSAEEENTERKKKKKEKKDRKEKEKEKNERKRDLTPDSTPEKIKGTCGLHEGLPTMAPTKHSRDVLQ